MSDSRASVSVCSKPTVSPLGPYVRILMFNQSGRLVKKKKTTVQMNTKADLRAVFDNVRKLII